MAKVNLDDNVLFIDVDAFLPAAKILNTAEELANIYNRAMDIANGRAKLFLRKLRDSTPLMMACTSITVVGSSNWSFVFTGTDVSVAQFYSNLNRFAIAIAKTGQSFIYAAKIEQTNNTVTP